jgi:hypothetical protein
MRMLSNGTILGDGIDEFLDFKDTSDENVANAKSLLLQLMEKRFDCFELMTDWCGQETDENKSQDEVTKEEKTLEEKNEKTDTLKHIQDSPRMERNPKKIKKIPIQPSEVAAEAGLLCNAVNMCLLPDKRIVLEGEARNASRCTKCNSPFHHECLFVSQQQCYCSKCFKQYVVTQCSTEILFKDLFQTNDWASSLVTGPTHRTSELRKYTNNFLQQNGLGMSLAQYEHWKMDQEKQQKKQTSMTKKRHLAKAAYVTKDKFERAIRIAKEEWLLSTDGVVKGLRYDAVDKKFVAKLHYQERGNVVKEETMTVSDDWVFDTYGIEVANRLIDHAENNGFAIPVDEHGKLVVIPMTNHLINRVKYIPQKVTTTENERGVQRTKIYAKAVWKGLQDDGTVCTLTENTVTESFGKDFVAQCKMLGDRKFVPIPVGSCRSSVISTYPHFRCDNAPPVHHRQGDHDTCTYSSLASAFHHTGIPELVKVAILLQNKSNRHCGGTKSLHIAKEIVTNNVKWLQPKRLPKNFDWEKDINDNMFVVGVIQDSTNCCEHAVTIFRNWIYNSNEPYALPLSKESLDSCTWEIRDGVIHEASLFVRFCDGWIFQEPVDKKDKKLI